MNEVYSMLKTRRFYGKPIIYKVDKIQRKTINRKLFLAFEFIDQNKAVLIDREKQTRHFGKSQLGKTVDKTDFGCYSVEAGPLVWIWIAVRIFVQTLKKKV